MKNFILYVWQLPQNLVGLLLVLFYRPERQHRLETGNIIYYAYKMKGGISLGKYSIVNVCHYRDDVAASLARNTVRHEAIGHAKQSRFLGWLYLPVVGLPSILWAACYGTIIRETSNGYYKFYTERWADKLGGVRR